jgi:hypothetical protein
MPQIIIRHRVGSHVFSTDNEKKGAFWLLAGYWILPEEEDEGSGPKPGRCNGRDH